MDKKEINSILAKSIEDGQSYVNRIKARAYIQGIADSGKKLLEFTTGGEPTLVRADLLEKWLDWTEHVVEVTKEKLTKTQEKS